MDVVYATATAVVPLPGGGRAHVAKGTHWPADDPVVLGQPSLFSPDARYGLNFSTPPAGFDAPVEQATAAPGERRNRRG
jgi:hypothetical protein